MELQRRCVWGGVWVCVCLGGLRLHLRASMVELDPQCAHASMCVSACMLIDHLLWGVWFLEDDAGERMGVCACDMLACMYVKVKKIVRACVHVCECVRVCACAGVQNCPSCVVKEHMKCNEQGARPADAAVVHHQDPSL